MNVEIVKAEVVEFHGQELEVGVKDGVKLVAVKPVVEGMGMHWGGQHKKLIRQKKKYGVSLTEMADPKGSEQKMLCIPINKLDLWLASIVPDRIKNLKVREKVEIYQAECAEALYNYFHKGFAIRASASVPVAQISLEDWYQERRARESLEHNYVQISPTCNYGDISPRTGLPRTEKRRSTFTSPRTGSTSSPNTMIPLFRQAHTGKWMDYKEIRRLSHES